jgi:uncharacterized protein (TIRG00374 family)
MRRFWKKFRFGIGIVFSLTFLWLTIREVAWSRVLMAIQAADWGLILLGSLLLVMTWGVFAIRWRVLLMSAVPIRWSDTFSYIMIGYLGNAMFPLRLGDVGRILLTNRKHGINIAFVSATLVLERLLDVLTMVALGGLLMLVVPVPELIRHGVQAAALTAIGIFVLLTLVVRPQSKFARLESYLSIYRSYRFLKFGFDILHMFAQALKVMTGHKQIVTVCLLSLLSWGIAGLSMLCYVRAFKLPVPWLAAVFLLVITNLGSAIPSSPGFVGLFEYLAVMALSVWLVDGSVSFGFATATHAVNLGLNVALGLIAAWREEVKLTALGKSLATTESNSIR